VCVYVYVLQRSDIYAADADLGVDSDVTSSKTLEKLRFFSIRNMHFRHDSNALLFGMHTYIHATYISTYIHICTSDTIATLFSSVCIHIYMLHTYIYMHTYILHTDAYVYTYIYIFIRTPTNNITSINIHIHAAYMYIHTYIPIYIHRSIYTHNIHMYIHTYTYTYIQAYICITQIYIHTCTYTYHLL